MKSSDEMLCQAMAAYNHAEQAPLAEQGLTWLGTAGPLYLCGNVRLRALAVDTDGTHWVDANLAIESAYLGKPAYEYFHADIGGLLHEAAEIWQVNFTRGRFHTALAPILDVCDVIGLHPPAPFPADNWARTYESDPDATDAELMALKVRIPELNL